MESDTITLEEGFDSFLEVRDTERREVFGRIIPYGQQITVRGRPESFALGAVAGVNPQRVKLLDHHKTAIGRMLHIEERADGAYASFRISKTAAGDEMLQLVADGVIDSFSPGFLTGVQDASGVHRRLKALPEVSLVTFPAYEGAKVLTIREENPMDETTDTQTTETVDLGPIEAQIGEVQTELRQVRSDIADLNLVGGTTTRRPLVRPVHWFMAMIETIGLRSGHEHRDRWEEGLGDYQRRVAAGEIETRELDDITGTLPGDDPITDMSAVVVEEYMADQLVNLLDRSRPAFASFGPFRGPRSGYAKIPRIVSGPVVAARDGQKEPANSEVMTSSLAPFEAKWFDGAVDIALELIQTAEIGVLETVWDRLLGLYAAATEHDPTNGAVPYLNSAHADWSHHGSALDTTTYEDFIDDFLTGAEKVEDETLEEPTQLAVTRNQYRALMKMTDDQGRRIFAPIGSQNADAATAITTSAFPLSGVRIFKVRELTRAVMFNEQALKAHDYGVSRVEALNVTLMGRDIGVLGRTMIVDRIPSGIYVYADGDGSA